MTPVPSLLLVDDDAASVAAMAHALQGMAELRSAVSGEAALVLAHQQPPDLVLLDAEMPGIGGFETCRRLLADPGLQRVAVIFVTSHGEPGVEVAGLEAGAADFIAKPVNPPLLRARVRTQLRVKQLHDDLHRLSFSDPLTGLANRRRLDEALALEWRRARRSGEPLGLVLLDVDHFKRFNDRYGHPAGDRCLRRVAEVLASAALRPADVVARYGGEEFIVLLPGTERAGTQSIAHRLVEAVAGLCIVHDDSPTTAHLSVSAGASSYDADSACWVEPGADSRFGGIAPTCTAPDLLRAADAALYATKQAGRAHARWLDVADADTPEAALRLGGAR